MQDNQSSILILAAKSYLSFIALLLFDKIDFKKLISSSESNLSKEKKNKGRNGTSHGHPVSYFLPIPAHSSNLELFGAIQSYIMPFGVIWSHLVPFGTTFSYLQPFGSDLRH